MRFVIDNSVVMRWLFGDRASADIDYAERILGIMQKDGSVAMAPAVWPLEVGNVIVRAESRNLLPEARSAEFLALLQDMAIEIEFRSTERALTDTHSTCPPSQAFDLRCIVSRVGVARRLAAGNE